jgi:hypothetical protein
MARSRADEILEGWKMVAHSAGRPASAPRPAVTRTTIPVGMLAAAAVLVVLVVVLSPRTHGPGPQATLPAAANPTATARVEPSATPSPSPSPSAAITASPAPTSTPPAGTPSPADASAARDALDRYTAALVRGDYATAWAMLAPEVQAHRGSLAAFTAERSAFFRSVAGRYTIVVWPADVAPITDWLSATDGATIDLHHAVLVEVDYPALAGNNAGYDLYIVNPSATGLHIFDVR